MKLTMDPHQVAPLFTVSYQYLTVIELIVTTIIMMRFIYIFLFYVSFYLGVKVLWRQARTKQNPIVFYAFVDSS